eukprot:272962_1
MDRLSDRLSKVNVEIERAFSRAGFFIGQWPWAVLGCLVVVYGVLASGLYRAESNTDILDLWTEKNSRLRPETDFIREQFGTDDFSDRKVSVIGYDKKARGSSVLSAPHFSDLTVLMRAVQD